MFLRHQNPFIHGGELNPLRRWMRAQRLVDASSSAQYWCSEGVTYDEDGGEEGDTGQWHGLTKYIYIYMFLLIYTLSH